MWSILFSNLAQVRGMVRPVLNEHLHLAAELTDGRTIVEQHLFIGRVVEPLTSSIRRLDLTRSRRRPQVLDVHLAQEDDPTRFASRALANPLLSMV